ncbi:hypothetical protein [Flavobacterium pectinovorum]|uniref:Periplasmic chaperone for outer membrane proteins Skp n=1 Tax=Flavobacterium pectinovorum TaxID=29533 RepID=A0A502ECW3_9FLAO|nr:hypothetical protein [Flavobacterium pectinovorum]TPG34812.1 hypothetical protein EAH81_22305 [Flavobacterium pectinovorum]
MKKLILMLVFALSANAGAQSVIPDDIALIQELYGKSKLEVVKEYLQLSEPQASAFQEVYDKYEMERKELGKKKIQILDEYAKNYAILSESKAIELTEANLKNNLDLEKLLSKTNSKMVKAIGGINAAKFVQLELYLQVTIRAEIQDSIPFIGELDKTKTK